MKIEGTRFTFIREYSDYPNKNSKKRTKMWEVQCECGKMLNRPKAQITSGNTKSCGCLAKDMLIKRNAKHGLRHDECYTIFRCMHKRCYDPKQHGFEHYGGRGIKVCEEWHDIKNFSEWCKANGFKKGLDLDRIDTNGDYEPSNCRFVTHEENLYNRRNTIIIDGMHFKEWLEYLSKKHNIPKTTLRSRYYLMKKYGFKDEDINEESIVNYKYKTRQSITTSKEKS